MILFQTIYLFIYCTLVFDLKIVLDAKTTPKYTLGPLMFPPPPLYRELGCTRHLLSVPHECK